MTVLVDAGRLGRSVALGLATLTLLALPAAAAAQCGEDYHEAPVRSADPGGPPLAIGDSVLADAVPLLARDGFEADGMVCRQMSQGLTILRERASRLPHLVVLALGTNGEVAPAQLEQALSIVGPDRELALVTPYGSVSPSAPAVIRRFASSRPGRVVLLDWDRLAAAHPGWLASDGVHLGGAEGIDAYARMIAGVLPGTSSRSAETQSTETQSPEVQSPEVEGSSEPGTPITIQPPEGHGGVPRQPSGVPPKTRSTAPRDPRVGGPSVGDRGGSGSTIEQLGAELARSVISVIAVALPLAW